MLEDIERRYPIERSRYAQSIGNLLEHRISQIFEELGFKTKLNGGQSNDVDLEVYYRDRLILVAEILNWSTGSYLSEKRKRWIIENLTSYNCNRVLIYTVFKNEYLVEDLPDYEISLLKLGYQLLPKHFYNFYAAKGQIESRRTDSSETKQDIKSKIKEYLQSSRIEVLTSILRPFSWLRICK